MSLWALKAKRGPPVDPNDPRAKTLRLFRGFAIFWIVISTIQFAAIGFVLQRANLPIVDAIPVFILLAAIVLIGSIWHAAAIATMVRDGTLDRRRPWDG